MLISRVRAASGLLLLCLLATSAPGARAEDATELWIGSWNIKFLGPVEGKGRNPTDEQQEEFVHYIDYSEVALLALQEIGQTTTGTSPRNRTLDRLMPLLEGDWRYALFDSQIDPKDRSNPPRSRTQNCAIAWDRSRVRKVWGPERVPVERGRIFEKTDAPVWKRLPYATKFSLGTGKTDLVVIPVHMKSNSGDAKATAAHKTAEAKELIKRLPWIKDHFRRPDSPDLEEDIVIIGDFNTKRAGGACMKAFAGKGFKDLNASDAGTWITRSAAPFVRAVVPASQPEFKDAF